jgi:hypothetical protein
VGDSILRQQLAEKFASDSWKERPDFVLPPIKASYANDSILPAGLFSKLILNRAGNKFFSYMTISNLDKHSFKCQNNISRDLKKELGSNWSCFGGPFDGSYFLEGEPVLSMQEYGAGVEIYMGGSGTVLCPFEEISFWGDMSLLSRFSTSVANVVADYFQKRNPLMEDLRNQDITMHL